MGTGSKLLGGGIVATDLAISDSTATGVALTMKRATEKLSSFAGLIVYSMSVDSPTNSKEGQQDKFFLAGSKSLDSLAKLVQATESFFHPSNYGAWAPHLGRFLRNVTWEFLKRQTEEERADCKTPLHLRLTPEIRHQFVLTMRTVALLSMFSRDPLTIANSQGALKTMAILEPELIFPSVLERSYPALETLLEVSSIHPSMSAHITNS